MIPGFSIPYVDCFQYFVGHWNLKTEAYREVTLWHMLWLFAIG